MTIISVSENKHEVFKIKLELQAIGHVSENKYEVLI